MVVGAARHVGSKPRTMSPEADGSVPVRWNPAARWRRRRSPPRGHVGSPCCHFSIEAAQTVFQQRFVQQGSSGSKRSQKCYGTARYVTCGQILSSIPDSGRTRSGRREEPPGMRVCANGITSHDNVFSCECAQQWAHSQPFSRTLPVANVNARGSVSRKNATGREPSYVCALWYDVPGRQR